MLVKKRNVICIPAKKYLSNIKQLCKLINITDLKILFCSNVLNNDTVNEIKQNFSSSLVQFFDYSENIDEYISQLYQICIIKDYESHFNLVPFFIERVQSNGIILLISNEFNGKDYHLSTFSKRFFNLLEDRVDFSITKNSVKFFQQIQPIDYSIDLCNGEQHKEALQPLIKSLDDCFNSSSKSSKQNSVVIVEGLPRRGKSMILCSGIASAIKFGLADIYVCGPVDINLKMCCENVRQLLISSFGYEETSLRIRYESQYQILEVVMETVIQKVRFINFQKEFSKNDTGLFCILEAGQFSAQKITKMLSFNPKLVWLTISTGGFHSVGVQAYQQTCRLFKTFCNIGETIFNEVDEKVTKSGTVIREHVNKIDRKKLNIINVNESISYDKDDDLETSVNKIFSLKRKIDRKFDKSNAANFFPEPNDCDLMFVAKETLFSGHPAAEILLEKFLDIYTSFDQKRSSHFLQLLVDDPNQYLFCLQQPKKDGQYVPEILCLAHVVIETESRNEEESTNSLCHLKAPQQQFLVGKTRAHIVRLVTQAKFQKLGYGRHILKMLRKYFSNIVINKEIYSNKITVHTTLQRADIGQMPTVLLNINELKTFPCSTPVSYMSVSFPATSAELMCFWRKCQFLPVDIKPISSNKMLITMVASCQLSSSSYVDNDNREQLAEIAYAEFCAKVGPILLHDLRDVHVTLAHEILFNQRKENMTSFRECTLDDITNCLDNRQLKKLNSFVQNIHTFESVQELFFHIASLYFGRRISDLHLAKYQELTLVGFGFQLKTTKQLATEMIMMERTNNPDAFSLRKDVLKKIPLLLSHIRDCGRVFLNYVTKIIDEHDRNEECPEKKRRLI